MRSHARPHTHTLCADHQCCDCFSLFPWCVSHGALDQTDTHFSSIMALHCGPNKSGPSISLSVHRDLFSASIKEINKDPTGTSYCSDPLWLKHQRTYSSLLSDPPVFLPTGPQVSCGQRCQVVQALGSLYKVYPSVCACVCEWLCTRPVFLCNLAGNYLYP